MNHILINAVVFLFGSSIGGMIYASRGCFAGADWSTTFAGGDIMDAPSQIRGGCDATQNHGLFDEMHNKLYNIANKPVVLPRRQYKLGDVKETGGGLQDSDRELLGSLYYNASSVFEFGLGESTEIAAYVGVPRYSGVDTDAVWVGSARDGSTKIDSSRNKETPMDHFLFQFADIGQTRLFGNPLNESLQKIPYALQSAPLNNEMEAFDVYLVDGRYRVACACASFLHAMSRAGDMKRVRVGVHDWARGKVGRIEDWHWGYWGLVEGSDAIAEVEHKSQLLAVLKLRSNTTEHDIMKMWEKHIWDRR